MSYIKENWFTIFIGFLCLLLTASVIASVGCTESDLDKLGEYIQGETGATGASGNITNTTATNLTGYIYGNGSLISSINESYYTEAESDTHYADTTTHGTTGDIVGTTDSQSLSNKTIVTPTLDGTITLDDSGQYIDVNSYARFRTNTSGGGIQVVSTDGGSAGGAFSLIHDGSSMANNDYCPLYYRFDNNVGQQYIGGQIICVINDVIDEQEDNKFTFYLMESGTINLAMQLDSDGTLYIDGTYETMDVYDDALLLSEGFRDGDEQLLKDVGVLVPKTDIEGNIIPDEFMLSTQRLMALLTGGVYQNRDKIDEILIRLDEAGIK